MKNPLALRALALFAVLSLSFGLSITASTPVGAVDIAGKLRPYFKTIWPQGWAFFTKDPKTPNIHIYRFDEQTGWTVDDIGRNGEAYYLFGWIRTPRARFIEAAFLMSFARDHFQDCTDDPVQCLTEGKNLTPIELDNPTPTPLICGRIAVVQQDPLPWAWLEAEAETTMHSRVIVLDVTCYEPT